MKLLRVGAKGKEKPAILDNNKIKDLSAHVEDFNPNYLNFEIITKLKKISKNYNNSSYGKYLEDIVNFK